ncbi:hypothetical protein TSUD_238990 [Trifolium subterraneum]|uniref:Uncharacterized protein n=1 Tax=Trifolium subterraneum TaxID=3900 RepID=A0A2Z6P1K8_TRISU|nr:hypothetical protein TSUD_238990 [Trifolium subterraneum]
MFNSHSRRNGKYAEKELMMTVMWGAKMNGDLPFVLMIEGIMEVLEIDDFRTKKRLGSTQGLTIRNNQLIMTQAQTLPSLTRPAAPRQLLQFSATENTRTPRYPGMTNMKIWLLST